MNRETKPRKYISPRDGHISYCSPWCGFDCHNDAFEQATKEADELAKIMGEGWRPRVWENCGWNYDVRKAKAEIHVHREGSSLRGGWSVIGYSGWLQTNPQFISGRHEDPKAAIGEAVNMAGARIAEILTAMEEVNK